MLVKCSKWTTGALETGREDSRQSQIFKLNSLLSLHDEYQSTSCYSPSELNISSHFVFRPFIRSAAPTVSSIYVRYCNQLALQTRYRHCGPDTGSTCHCGPDTESYRHCRPDTKAIGTADQIHTESTQYCRPEKWLAMWNGYWKWLALWNRKVLVCKTA